MIELTREEALVMLKALSQIDGYLLGVEGSYGVAEILEMPCDLLIKKLGGRYG